MVCSSERWLMSSLSVGSLYFVDDNYPGGSDAVNLQNVNQRMKNDFGNLLLCFFASSRTPSHQGAINGTLKTNKKQIDFLRAFFLAAIRVGGDKKCRAEEIPGEVASTKERRNNGFGREIIKGSILPSIDGEAIGVICEIESKRKWHLI